MPPACWSASWTLWVIRLTSTMGVERAHRDTARQGWRAVARGVTRGVRLCSARRPGAVRGGAREEPGRLPHEVHDLRDQEERLFPERDRDVANAVEDTGLLARETRGTGAPAHL